MDIFTIVIWVVTLIFLIISLLKDKTKTKNSLKMALGMGKSMILSILSIVFLIGLVLTFIPPNQIASYVGKQNIILATIASAALGTITLIPAFIAFPLVGTMVNAGVSIIPSVAFLTTLTMVGIVTLPLERREFGIKFALTRNGLSFIFAILIALIMGVLM